MPPGVVRRGHESDASVGRLPRGMSTAGQVPGPAGRMYEESANDAEVSSGSRSSSPPRARRTRRTGSATQLAKPAERDSSEERPPSAPLSKRAGARTAPTSSIRRAMGELALFVLLWLAMMARMAHSVPAVQHKIPQLALLGILLLVCFVVHLSSASTIWATRVRYLRKSEVSDILYAFLLPLLVTAQLLDAVPSATPRALAPPRIALGARGDWRAEALPWPTDRLRGRGGLVDLHVLCAALIGVHVLLSSFSRRQRKRLGRHLGIETLPMVHAFLYYHVFGVVLALSFSAAHVAMRMLGYHAYFLADLPTWAVFTISISFQCHMYLWTRVAQRNCTLGELAIICALITAMFHEALVATMARLVPSQASMLFREPSAVLVYQLALMVGMLVIGALLSPLLVLSRNLARRPTHRLRWPDKRNLHRRLLALAFFVLSTALVLGVLAPWVAWQLGGKNPWLYIVRFMLQGRYWWLRLALAGYWGMLCNIALLSIQLMVHRVWQYATVGDHAKKPMRPRQDSRSSAPIRTALSATERASALAATQFAEVTEEEGSSLSPQVAVSVNGRRKFFHALAVLLFVPGIAWDPAFMHLAFSTAFALFILGEYLRYCAVYPVGASLHVFLSQFLDNKDTGLLIMSHVYLLCGCAAGLWAESQSRVAQQMGVLVLGVGDSAASIVGRYYGRWHWPRSQKTVEGTLAFVASTVAGALLLRVCGLVEPFRVLPLTAVAVLLALVEGVAEQNDNLVLPLTGLVLLSMIPIV